MVSEGKKLIRDIIDFIDYDELIKLRKDLQNGGLHLLKLVNNKIKEIELSHDKYCSSCGTKIDRNASNNYTLVFGSYDFRKKASFCGVDCMEQFIQKLKDIRSYSDKFMSSYTSE